MSEWSVETGIPSTRLGGGASDEASNVAYPQNLLRGYFEGRYRDLGFLGGQVEWRFPIYWRFRGVLFAGAGDVAHRLDAWAANGLKVAGGSGLRFSLNDQERLNLRLDVGVGPGTWGAYVSIAEAF